MGILEEEVFTKQPKGFVDKSLKNMEYKLNKKLLDLKQTSQAWYERFHSYVMRIGSIRTSDNYNLYLKS